MQTRSISGKVAVVTGASSGIGAAAARLLAREGVRVVLVARSHEKLAALTDELGDMARAIPADVGIREQVRGVFDQVRDEFGGLDLLFNNAGVGYFGLFADSDPEDWKKMIDANLYGVLHCSQAAIPLMRGRPGAMISTVSSIAGRRGRETLSVYAATKFAVVGFHDALRRELAQEGIRVSLLEPGAVYTNWGHNIDKDDQQQRREKLQAMQPDDIANALLYTFAQPDNVNISELLVLPTRQL